MLPLNNLAVQEKGQRCTWEPRTECRLGTFRHMSLSYWQALKKGVTKGMRTGG